MNLQLSFAQTLDAQSLPQSSSSSDPGQSSQIVDHPSETPMDEDHSINPLPQTKLSAPIASDQYWDAMARCETNTRWNRDFKWGGGLGIYFRTWQVYGGDQFAPRAGLASRAEQIEIANRIATLGHQTNSGYFIRPVGFHAWGCARRLTLPILVWHRTYALLVNAINEPSSDRILELQAALGIAETSQWDENTSSETQRLLERYQQGLGFDHLGPYHPSRHHTIQQLALKNLRVVGTPDSIEPANTSDSNP